MKSTFWKMTGCGFAVLVWSLMLANARLSYADDMMISGRITDSFGEPVEDAHVVFTDIISPYETFDAYSGADGSYAVTFTTSVDEAHPSPFSLGQNYPNPFNPSTVIPFKLDRSCRVRLTIFNSLGQKIRMLIDERLPAGSHTVTWHGTDVSGNGVAAGLYLYRLSDGSHTSTRKMLLVDGGTAYVLGSSGVSAYGTAEKKSSTALENLRYFKVTVTKEDFIPYADALYKRIEGKYLDVSITRIMDRSGFLPGAVFREYKWDGPWINASKWQRVTDPDATASGAHEFLPNPVNRITIDDLDNAVRAEVYIELLQCHAGTTDKRIRLNGSEWLDIPEAGAIPGGHPENYQTMTYPAIELPLDCLMEGDNIFELTNGGAVKYMTSWGQFLIYGLTFRIYYSDDKPHPTGFVSAPLSGDEIVDNPTFTADVGGSGIKQVDFIGLYDDFNYEGDNIWRQWHYVYRLGKIRHHLGTATEAPYSIVWDTSWIPDQDEPLQVMARIVDDTNLCYLTPAVEGIQLKREGRSVKLYKPYDVPEHWVSRANAKHTCKIDIVDDLDTAVSARLLMVSWSGQYAQKIGINDTTIVRSVGYLYDLSYNEIDVPLDLLSPGVNKPFTYSSTQEHGIEVNWPGIALKVVNEE